MITRRNRGVIPGMVLAAALLVSPMTALSAQAATDPSATHGDGFVLSGDTVHPRIPLGTNARGNPDSVDLRAWAPEAGDQSYLNSCVSWALGYSILGWYANKMGYPTTLAPMYIYSQTHLSNSADGGGSYVRDAMGIVSNQGVDTIDDYQPQDNYNFTDAPTAAQRTNAAYYKTLGYTRLFSSAAGNVGTGGQAVIEASLAADHPVGLAIPIYANFYYLDDSDYEMTLAKATGGIYGYHYTAALGYDSTGVWIENSWGPWWGQNGFAHLNWDFVNSKAVEAESVYGFTNTSLPQATPAPTPTPTPTPTAEPTSTPTPTVTPTPTPTVDPTPTVTPTPTPTVDPTPTITPVPTPTFEPTPTPTTEPSIAPVPTVTTITPVPTVAPVQPTPDPVVQPVTPITPPVETVPVEPAPTVNPTPVTDTATVSGAPTHLTIATTTSAINLRWAAPTDDGGTTISGYQVTVSRPSFSRILATLDTTAKFTGLSANTTYTISVRAQNSIGLSAAITTPADTDALPPKMGGITATINKNLLKTSWTAKSVTGSGQLTKIVVTLSLGKKTISKKNYKPTITSASVKLAKQGRYLLSITVYALGGEHVTTTRTVNRP